MSIKEGKFFIRRELRKRLPKIERKARKRGLLLQAKPYFDSESWLMTGKMIRDKHLFIYDDSMRLIPHALYVITEDGACDEWNLTDKWERELFLSNLRHKVLLETDGDEWDLRDKEKILKRIEELA